MSKIKVGIIGCGGIAFGKHLPAIKTTGLAEIIGFCDTVEERAKKAFEEYGAEKACKEYGTKTAKVYKTYKELIADKDIEAVYILTPNRSHSEISVAALKAGKHVMCEKPMAINAAEAEKMVKAAKESGKLLSIGYQNRYRADSRYVKDFAQEGGFGDMYFARAKAIRRRAVPTWGVFLNEHEQGGGPLIDIGTHALDLTLWVMDNYKPKYAVGTIYHKLNNEKKTGNAWGDWDAKEFTVEDSAFGFVVMENGATIVLESSWALNDRFPQEAVFTLSGTKAGVDFVDGLHINSVQGGKQTVTKVDFGKGGVAFYDGTGEDPAVLEQEVFLNAVLGKGELTVTPEQAYTVTLILEAIYKSAKTGKPVYFD
ncbi:MAG: Gfo/Idh/MocA family oxidoreductase [Oscillospiraceae bacterium]|nr:Gfo/Idh/MocA family oxidoreductase [Oscillospiraceae bacterium]